jgi:tetratricopeptide (TPR) repeat protein
MLIAAPMRARMHGLGLGLLLVVATSVPALAQQPGSTPSKSEYLTCAKEQNSDAAHAKYLSGKVDYDEGKYDSAIQNFRAAYEKDCAKHELLVIISRAHELNQNLPEAIRALEVYLEKPNATDAGVHRAKINTLKERLAEERKKAAATPPPSGSTAPPPPPEQGHTIYPWLVVGGGVLAASIGVTLLVARPDTGCNLDTRECDRKPGENDADYKKRQDDAGREHGWGIAGPILIAGGAVMVAGGIVWHLLEPTGPKESSKTRVKPQVGPGYGGFALTGRF